MGAERNLNGSASELDGLHGRLKLGQIGSSTTSRCCKPLHLGARKGFRGNSYEPLILYRA